MDTTKINTNNTAQNIPADKPQMSEKAPQFPFLLRRFTEFLFTSILCSVPVAILYGIDLLPRTDDWALKIMGVSLFFFAFISIYLLRAFYYSMGNKNIYYNTNFAAYLIFSILNIIALIILKDNELPSLYSYLFMPMKFANVILNMICSTASIKVQILAPIATHLLMLFIIFAAPLEMYTFDKKKK